MFLYISFSWEQKVCSPEIKLYLSNTALTSHNFLLTDWSFPEKKSSKTFLDNSAVTLQVAVIIPEHPNCKLLNNFNSEPGKTEKFSIFNFSNKL